MYGDRRDNWRLCFDGPADQHFEWSGYGWWGGPPVEQLSCDLGHDGPADGQDAAKVVAGCHLVISE